MDIDNAPVAKGEDDDDEDVSCDDCDGGTYVLYEGEKLCRSCGYVAGSAPRQAVRRSDDWATWVQHRRSEYSGWYGERRIKFVGGFVSAYQFDEDFNVEETILV